jgi:hypothetical protein
VTEVMGRGDLRKIHRPAASFYHRTRLME